MADAQLVHGIPAFVDRLINDAPSRADVGAHAGYGDPRQAITDLAFERGVPMEIDEFRTLNRCLDNGIANAVPECALQRDALVKTKAVEIFNERLGFSRTRHPVDPMFASAPTSNRRPDTIFNRSAPMSRNAIGKTEIRGSGCDSR